MSIKRRQKREGQFHFAVLADHLGQFYEFLSKSPQPSDEEVRSKFLSIQHSWKQYCAKKQLNASAYPMFNQEVARLWRLKRKQNDEIGN